MLTNVLLDSDLLENATHSDAARIISQLQIWLSLTMEKDKLLLPVGGFKENDVIQRCLSTMSHFPKNRLFWWSD